MGCLTHGVVTGTMISAPEPSYPILRLFMKKENDRKEGVRPANNPWPGGRGSVGAIFFGRNSGEGIPW